jgi:hypothetical protein
VTLSDRLVIFDTTLRDGEQSPGCSMTQREKTLRARGRRSAVVEWLLRRVPLMVETGESS